MTKIFAIRCKATGEFVVYNSKCAWTKAGNAKNAWANGNRYGPYKSIKFDDQDEYELLELTEYVFRMEGLEK